MTSDAKTPIPLAIPNLCGNEAVYLQQCVSGNFVSTVGPFVQTFETLVAAATKSPYVVATCSGTSALHLGLNVAGVQRDDLVIIPSYTFIASAHAIKYTGADPWIFDICEEDWGLDPILLEQTLSADCEMIEGIPHHKKTGRKIAALMTVWALGIPCRMDEIIRIGKTYNIPIVVDAAGALGSLYKGRELGELDVACAILSFNGNKIVTSGGGGAVLTRSEAFAEKTRHLATTARLAPSYIHDEIGYNYRMTNLEAAVGCAQIENLPRFLEAKKKANAAYRKILQRFQSLRSFPGRTDDRPNHWLSGLLLPSKDLTDNLAEYLNDNAIDARHCWVPLHLQPKFKDSLQTAQPISENIYQRVLTLPCSTQITDRELDRVVTRTCNGLAQFGGAD